MKIRPVGCLILAIVIAGLSAGISTADDETRPQRFLLWPDGAPQASGSEEKDKPSLTLFKPSLKQQNGCAMVVCPGGGYGGLAVSYEGDDIARWLNSQGVTAFVLRYRHAPSYRHPVPLLDVQRSIRTLRANAKKWKIDPDRIGVIGFSAGGHLASTAGTHFDNGILNATDPIEHVSCRPNFLVLAYPVISLRTAHTHRGSRRNLLGNSPDPKLVESLSNETQVTNKTPPTFLVHTTNDKAVDVENSVLFYLALRRAGVAAEMHIYEDGPHGFGLGKKDPILATWPKHCHDWFKKHGFLDQK